VNHRYVKSHEVGKARWTRSEWQQATLGCFSSSQQKEEHGGTRRTREEEEEEEEGVSRVYIYCTSTYLSLRGVSDTVDDLGNELIDIAVTDDRADGGHGVKRLGTDVLLDVTDHAGAAIDTVGHASSDLSAGLGDEGLEELEGTELRPRKRLLVHTDADDDGDDGRSGVGADSGDEGFTKLLGSGGNVASLVTLELERASKGLDQMGLYPAAKADEAVEDTHGGLTALTSLATLVGSLEDGLEKGASAESLGGVLLGLGDDSIDVFGRDQLRETLRVRGVTNGEVSKLVYNVIHLERMRNNVTGGE